MKKRLRLIFIAFCISFAIMASLSLFALKQFSGLIENSGAVDDTYQLISRLHQLSSLTKEIDLKEYSFIITRDSSYHREMETLHKRVIPFTDSLKLLFPKDPEQNRWLSLLKSELILKRDNTRENLLLLVTDSTSIPAPLFSKGREIRLRTEELMEKMRRRAGEALDERAQVKIYYQEVTFSTIRYLLAIFAFITLVLFFFMIRELKTRMAFQDELQMKVADLKRSHAELEQIAHAVSHDLQEPLRKIQIFSNRMLYVKKDKLDEESTSTLERINNSATRMHELIDDLMNLTSLVKEEQMEQVDLNEALQMAVSDLEEKIREKGATIQTEAMPEITGHGKQIQLMLRSLLDNSLKFSKDGKSPVISVRSDRVNGTELKEHHITATEQTQFYRITIADNGIGFDDKFVKKMFQIFQSLHNKQSEYSGKGIGLPICQRVMANHGGYIIAHGKPNIGATFKLFFPIKE